MIQVFHPGSGSRIWILTFYLSQIPVLDPRSWIQGSKRQRIRDPGSRIRIRNTGDFRFAQAVGGSISYWLSTGAAVLRTHSMDQLSEAFMCKKEFSVYFIFTLSLYFLLFLSYDALRICFLTHLVHGCRPHSSLPTSLLHCYTRLAWWPHSCLMTSRCLMTSLLPGYLIVSWVTRKYTERMKGIKGAPFSLSPKNFCFLCKFL